MSAAAQSTTTALGATVERDSWGNGMEFLMSCIAMSVGLGNVWRFPFSAMENGGGAFLIPYLIVLAVVGRPIYYLEMIIGQFSSRGSVKVYDLCPAMRGKSNNYIETTTLISPNGKLDGNKRKITRSREISKHNTHLPILRQRLRLKKKKMLHIFFVIFILNLFLILNMY